MATKADAANLEWFGADTETSNSGRTTTAVLEKFNGVPAYVPKNVMQPDGTTKEQPVLVQPKANLRTRTSGRDDRIAELTARYKLAREAFTFAPPDDKDTWERRMKIAFCEMQLERFAQQLEKYQARSDARPEQIEHYQQRIDAMRGRWLRLTGQGD